jgi:tetratricopeptide (TPR) repeat protein
MIGTYRPVEMLSEGHPLKSIVQELYGHGLGTELTLETLSEAAVGDYLTTRLGRAPSRDREGAEGQTETEAEKGQPLADARGSESGRARARTLYQRTGGNPLFLVSTVDDLVARGILTQTEDIWTLPHEIEDIGIADSIRHLVARQSGRLLPEERHTLEAASVAGMEFSVAAVAAALASDTATVERRCEQLAERQQFLKRLGVEAWPDGTLAARYGFLHALYQQLWHERVSPTQLQHHHLQIGERKERAYGERVREIAAELVVHFEQGRDYRRAVQYLQLAGENAVRRSAYQEAIELHSRGLNLLQTLRDTPERAQQELTLQLALGAPLMATKGFAAPEARNVYARARELCQQAGETPQLFSVLRGLWEFYHIGAELQTARALAEQLLTLAHNVHDPALFLEAHSTLGMTLMPLGEWAPALKHCEQLLALYTPQQHHTHAFLYGGYDPGVNCLGWAAWCLWGLGYPTQAVKRISEALTLAQELSHPYTTAFAQCYAAQVHQFRREGVLSQERAETAQAFAIEHGFPLKWGAILRGWALVEQGQEEEGLVQMRQNLHSLKLLRPYFLALIAEAHGKLDQTAKRLAVLTEALALVDKTGERWCEAELYRLYGELSLRIGETERIGDKNNLADSPFPLQKKPFSRPSTLLVINKPRCGSCAPPSASHGCGNGKASTTKRAKGWQRSTTGLRKDLTRWT